MANRTFESLPDELLLQICSYLRSSDVLYSFFDLNTRINTTIEGYCHYINLLAPAYKPFHHVISYVLPRIGTLVRSFVLNGNWQPVLPQNILNILYGSELSSFLPNLEILTLKWFTTEQLSTFLDSFGHFSQLHTLNILILNGETEENLLTKIVSANNGQIKTIIMDEDCINLNIPESGESVSYPNIEELTININLNESFLRLFQLFPNIRRLHIKLGSELYYSNCGSDLQAIPPLIHLTDFRLRSINTFWTSDEILNLLSLMPSLQKLTLDIRSDDDRFVKENSFVARFSSSTIQLHLFLRYYPGEEDFVAEESVGLWNNYGSIASLLDETRSRVLLYTIPIKVRSLVLPAAVSKQINANCTHFQNVKDLYIYDATHVAELYSILRHFHCLQSLNISAKHDSETRM